MNRIAINNFDTIDIQIDIERYVTCTVQHIKTGQTFKIRILPLALMESARIIRTNIILPRKLLTSYILYKHFPDSILCYASEDLNAFDRKFVKECILQAHFACNEAVWNTNIPGVVDLQITKSLARVRLPHLDLELDNNRDDWKPPVDLKKLRSWLDGNHVDV